MGRVVRVCPTCKRLVPSGCCVQCLPFDRVLDEAPGKAAWELERSGDLILVPLPKGFWGVLILVEESIDSERRRAGVQAVGGSGGAAGRDRQGQRVAIV